ncbi:MAG TPA: DUF2442 domain-containing protein [Terriglobia bacterium]|nr:DUF2442 domain-containing protein [Terriglobia bacterium]
MDYDVVEASLVSGYTLRIKFRDGTEGEIDLEPELYGPVFEPLHDPEQFKLFRVHPELHTIAWPNGADLAPEFLHEHVRIAAR